MKQYILRNIPPDLWGRFSSKAKLDNWHLRALFLQLMDDFAHGRVSPSVSAPDQVAEFAWLRPVYRRLAREPRFQQVDAMERWRILFNEVGHEQPLNLTRLANIFPHKQEEILNWLRDTTQLEIAEPNRLTMRVIATGGRGPNLNDPDRQPIQYEVLGLPPGQGAWIANMDHRWQILREFNGTLGKWHGEYESAHEALRALEERTD